MYHVASSLMTIQALYGIIHRINGKGDMAKVEIFKFPRALNTAWFPIAFLYGWMFVLIFRWGTHLDVLLSVNPLPVISKQRKSSNHEFWYTSLIFPLYYGGKKVKKIAQNYQKCEKLTSPVIISQWNICDKVFKNGPSKICGKQPLKNLKWYGLLRQTISLEIF